MHFPKKIYNFLWIKNEFDRSKFTAFTQCGFIRLNDFNCLINKKITPT